MGAKREQESAAMSGKVDVQAQIGDGRLEPYPESVVNAAQRLLTDSRMIEGWNDGFGSAEFWQAVFAFDGSQSRDEWSRKSQRARDEWARKFHKAVDDLIELMEEAPTTPKQWGFPARDAVLANVVHRMGFPMPEWGDPAFFGRVLELEAAADAEHWTLVDSLRHYETQQRGDCIAKQVLRKPGDEQARRAQFIVEFRKHTRCTAKTVAAVATVMFDDNTIDDRLVRRLTSRR